jgi:uncharacterized protein DUF5666
MRNIKRITLALCVLLPVLVVAACGGGAGGGLGFVAGGVGTGGTGITFGTITGFGSVVVDGTPYSSATPQYFAGTNEDEAAPVSSAALELGNQLQVQIDAQGNPTDIVVEPELVGAVSGISGGQFVVNGVAVRVNTNSVAGPITYFSGLASFSGLAKGMQVEVHGAYGTDANSQQAYVQASLVEQLPNSNVVNRVSGFVSDLNAAAGTFHLGGTTVQTNVSTSVLPTGTALANGQWVNVWSNIPFSTNGTLTAGVVRVRTLSGVTGPVQIGGVVSSLSGTQFQVSGLVIDASAQALASALRSLSPGEYVIVQGQANSSTGALVASSIRPFATQPTQVELTGTITGFVNPGSFLVRGVPVDASQAQFLGAASAASLRDGIFVDVLGSVSSVNGNVVTAKSVSVPSTAPTGGTVNYRGTVSQFDAAKGAFVLTGQLDGSRSSTTVTLAPNVAYANGSAAQLVNGANVEVEGTKTASGIVAYGVSFLRTGAPDDPSSGNLETHGLAYGITSSSFQVNSLTIQINGVTPDGGPLVNGAKVEVKFTSSGGQNLAQAISIDR